MIVRRASGLSYSPFSARPAACPTPPGLAHSDPARLPIVVPVPAPTRPRADPLPAPDLRPLAINLPTALQLANANAIDVAAAAERVRIAAAQLEQARVLWLPTVTLGGDYNRHDGRIQNADGSVIDASRGSLMFGAGTGIGSAAVLSV